MSNIKLTEERSVLVIDELFRFVGTGWPWVSVACKGFPAET